MLVVLLFAIMEVAARKKVDEGRVHDDVGGTTSRRKALDIVDIIAKSSLLRRWVDIFNFE